jgi:hypothetical protein
MGRETTDEDGVTWSCIQAFAGLGNGVEKADAARVDGETDRFYVVCTPSGGARSVRLELPGGWEQAMADEELIEAIHARLDDG